MEKSPKNRDIRYTKRLFYWKFVRTTRIIGIFDLKTYSRAFVTCKIYRKLGIFDEIFPKNRKIRNYRHKIKYKTQQIGRKLRKIGFFAKTGNTSKSLSLQLVAQVSIVENTENSHNTRLYTIQQIGEKFSPIITKIWHFLKCHNNCISKA